MNLLVDTRILVWTLLEPERIPRAFEHVLVDPSNEIWYSSLSVWEIVTKIQIGKMSLGRDFETAIKAQGLKYLPFESRHALKQFDLPLHHRDPFDRGLMAQAAYERLKLMTSDQTLRQYADNVDLIMVP
ncbi:MAG: type II toxin-antitoxin system VapC family toxin [Armatimonadetes bacterium]|nr:type II toxin-antitoxin system VapC family toxin [Armatimonadota bacterium]MBS1703769.1 type II toxin-antitoxin system VapC family toxin [Armatimonadota bacterium]MBS1726143.1 type II toxin-antitoxin system VapC family toxin [Armatimonadota bacterium]